MGFCDTPGQAFDVAISGKSAFVANGEEGLRVIDVSVGSNPHEVGFCDTPGRALGVALSGTFAYIADGEAGLQIIDVEAGSSPELVGSFSEGNVAAVAVVHDIAYLCGEELVIVDVSTPSNPVELGSLAGVRCLDIAVDGIFAYLACDDGVRVVDISTGSTPEVIGEPGDGIHFPIFGIAVSRPFLYLAAGDGLQIDSLLQCSSHSPVVTIVSPSAASAITNNSAISVVVDNFELDCEGMGKPNVEGMGYWKLWVDGTFDSNVCTETAVLTGSYDEGVHTIRAQLVGGEGRQLDPPAEHSVDVFIGDRLWAVAAAANVSGTEGTSWVTDVVLHNPDAFDAEAGLRFLEDGLDNSLAEAVPITVPAFASLRLVDIISATFGRSETTGAILVNSNKGLLVTSRTYNDAEQGTYGQYIPGVPRDQWITGSDAVVLLQLTGTADFRTNIGVANLGDEPLEAQVELFSADASSLGTFFISLPAWSYEQVNEVFANGAPVEDGYAVISAMSESAAYLTYASVVDDSSGDPEFIAPVTQSAEALYVPAAAHVAGDAGTNWFTDLEIYNTSTIQAQYRLELLEALVDNSDPLSVAFTLDSAGCVRYEDVLGQIFEATGSGAIRIVVDRGQLMVTSRTYNDLGSSTFGQFIPGFALTDAIGQGAETRLIQLSHSADDDSGFRTNIGFASATDHVISVEVELFLGDGTSLGSRAYSLEPFGYFQENDIFAEVAGGDVENGFAVLRSLSPGALYFAYASVVDNRSGDPVYIPALRAAQP